MKTTSKFLAAAAIMLMALGSAKAVTVTIGLQEAGFNGGAITTVATGVNTLVSFAGPYGTFSGVSVGATGSPPNTLNDLLSSTALKASSAAPGTLNIWVTAQNILAPTGLFDFLSSFTSNTLPAGWSVTETTFISTTNGLFSGAVLSSHAFNSIDTFLAHALANTGGGPFSVSHLYTVTATSLETGLSTIDLQVTPIPGPVVGAGLPGLIAACGGLLMLARRRRKLA